MHMQWLWWSLRRGMMFPFVWVIVHVMVFLWQALDPRYVQKATFIADWVLKPLHPWIVWIVQGVFPALTTYVGNKPPTYEDAPKVLYPLLMGLIGFVILMGWSLIKRHIIGVRDHQDELEHTIRIDERRQVLREIATGQLIPPALEAHVAIEQRGSYRDRPATGYFSGEPLEPRSDRLQERLRRVKPEEQA